MRWWTVGLTVALLAVTSQAWAEPMAGEALPAEAHEALTSDDEVAPNAAALVAPIEPPPVSLPRPEPASWRGLHPDFPLLDEAGRRLSPPVVDLSRASARATCGACHDADYILSHDSHGAQARTPAARAALKDLGVDCFRCHLPGGLPQPPPAAGAHAPPGETPEPAAPVMSDDGIVRAQLHPPSSETCGQCHGAVFSQGQRLAYDASAYLAGADHGPFGQTLRTGEVFSPQLVSSSFVNLAARATRTQPWDVHAARGLSCASCHFAPNDPARAGLLPKRRQPHLIRDPRALEAGEYLARPDHRLATARCDACHDPAVAHQTLPARARHLDALSCQACHGARMMAPTPRVVDQTVFTPEGGPRLELRGVAEREWDGAPSTWFSTGYQPFLLREPVDEDAPGGPTRLAPYNLQARWRWIDRGQARAPAEVPIEAVRRAWQDPSGAYHAELLPLFDDDGDGRLVAAELVLDSEERVAAIRGRLQVEGVADPAILASVEAHPVRHGVVTAAAATADCQSCHARASRLNEAIPLVTGALPGGLAPTLDEATRALLGGRSLSTGDRGLWLSVDDGPSGRYVLGHDRPWSDWIGLLAFAATLLGVALHAGLRVIGARRAPVAGHGPTERVYMYGTYERVWHWVMALSVILLLLTGLRIHFPWFVPVLGYASAVFLHDLVAVVFIVNASLSLFYHLTTDEIRQYIPAHAGFVQRVLIQARYYVSGIFVRAAHPLAKTPDAKLNPLQQVTYLGLLNGLFPFQILTGALMWIGGRWPEVVTPLGGLTLLGPLHNLGSWLFLTFLVMHVYLTTTGHTLTSNLKAMIDGWDEVDAPAEAPPSAAAAAEGAPR